MNGIDVNSNAVHLPCSINGEYILSFPIFYGKKGYLSIEASVLLKGNKIPLPVYEKIFSAAEKGFLSETDENLKCLGFLSANFRRTCIRTLDRGFDAKDYYRYHIIR